MNSKDENKNMIQNENFNHEPMRNQIEGMRKRSGTITSEDKLTSFLYELMRDHIPCGVVEKIMLHLHDEHETIFFTNGWLASYAKDIAERLK